MSFRDSGITVALLAALLILTYGIYQPGLSAGFIFDDIPNLQMLDDVEDSSSSREAGLFAASGISSALGRPVSLFSFVLQADSWPGNPQDFHFINIMIHLFGGVLVFAFVWLLATAMGQQSRRPWLALAVTFLWLLTPLQVSTVLYTIQRMAQLSALFTLVGLIAYLAGRARLLRGQINSGYLLMSVGVVVGGILATLSKENGVLLVIYILVMEMTVLRMPGQIPFWRLWFGAFVLAPLALLALYIAISFPSMVIAGFEMRTFSLGERLLSESRALIDYIGKLIMPRNSGFALFNDDFPVSHTLLDPPQTLITMAIVIAGFISALLWRRRFPIMALGVLWFLGGHFLESSIFPLYLYFEHRNYLPILGVIITLVMGASLVFERLPTSKLKALVAAMLGVWMCLHPAIALQQTRLWGDPFKQAVVWAHQQPDSVMAQDNLTNSLVKIGRYERAAQRIRQSIERFPNRSGSYLSLLSLSCYASEVGPPDPDSLVGALKADGFNLTTLHGLDSIVRFLLAGECPTLDVQRFEQMFGALLENPAFENKYPEINHILGLYYLSQSQWLAGVDALGDSLALKEDYRLRLEQVSWLLLAEQPDRAHAVFDKARQLIESDPLQSVLYEKKLNALQEQINRAEQTLLQ